MKTLAQTLSLVIGRVGVIAPDALAVILPEFLRPWCLAMDSIKQNDFDKETAFK